MKADRIWTSWLRAIVVLVSALLAGLVSAGSDVDDVTQLAAFIDRQIEKVCERDRVQIAPAADDAEFLRRVSLDLSGKIPAVSDVRPFLDDPAADKRSKRVDRLLESPRYVVHFTNVWRALLLPEAANDPRIALQVEGFESWLRTQLLEDVGYDRIAHRLITTELQTDTRSLRREPERGPTPVAFYLAKEGKPENLAAGIARQFLGLRLECAQCHDHPFANWKRQEFWGMAAFFSGIQAPNPFSLSEIATANPLTIPGTQTVAYATYLDGTRPESTGDARTALADWITSPSNPCFAKAAVNRLWAHFFGIGLVIPVDDMEADNPASHPEILDRLAQAFVDHDYDLKFLIRVITMTQAYQRSSRQTHESQEDPRYFARMTTRGLSPEQIFESLAQATGIRDEQARQEFQEQFTTDASMPIDTQSTILQALTMMNGSYIAAATDVSRSATLTAVAEFPGFDTRQRLETLFLASLTRLPSDEELGGFAHYIDTAEDPKQALADVFWALLNSTEFLVNH